MTSDPLLLKRYKHLGLQSTPGITVDMAQDDEDFFVPIERKIPGHGIYRQVVPRRPQFIASVDDLPFANESFDVVLSDPPYTRSEELAYNEQAQPYPLKAAVTEAYRVLRPNGFFAMLHTYTGPPRSNKQWTTRAVIAVAPSTQMNRTRTLSIIQKKI